MATRAPEPQTKRFFLGLATLLPLQVGPAFASGAVTVESNNYHTASTAAEAALDNILKQDNADGTLNLFILKRPDRDLSADILFSGLFTPALEAAWAEAETEAVAKQCSGQYDEDYICGLDYSPLLCAQDISEDGYLYQTGHSDGNTALISVRWPWLDQPVATYRIVLQNGKWLLDGVTCLPDGTDFNPSNGPRG
ncbi:hypothetical protein [Radicibacter daui]|uniref:hypothetical protein n=1 Tax=Radicibacter daui TaxID=3064829 RepID=UPI004046AD4D